MSLCATVEYIPPCFIIVRTKNKWQKSCLKVPHYRHDCLEFILRWVEHYYYHYRNITVPRQNNLFKILIRVFTTVCSYLLTINLLPKFTLCKVREQISLRSEAAMKRPVIHFTCFRVLKLIAVISVVS